MPDDDGAAEAPQEATPEASPAPAAPIRRAALERAASKLACRLSKTQVTQGLGVVCPICKEQRKHGRLIYKCEGCQVHRCPGCFEACPDGRCVMDEERSRIVWSPAPRAMICTGREALKAVGQNDGCWNWALVGPDPEALPLAGGGAGSVDEMRGCLAKQEAESGNSVFYGLLRLTFGKGRGKRTKFVFVRVSRVDDAGIEARVALQYGKATGQRSLMEKAMQEFARFSVTFEALCVADLTLDEVLERVRKASTADAELLTLEAFHEAMDEFRKAHGQADAEAAEKEAQIQAAAAEIFKEMRVPAEAEAPPAAAESPPPAAAEEVVLEEEAPADQACEAPQEENMVEAEIIEPQQSVEVEVEAEVKAEDSAPNVEASPAPPPAPAADADKDNGKVPAEKAAEEAEPDYKRGDYVLVLSKSHGEWVDDGVILMSLKEDGNYDKMDLPAGAIKVQYNEKKTFKWLLPHQVKENIRPSSRPRPPPNLTGELVKETHGWVTQWHVRYFELSKGDLKWWMKKADAEKGVAPNGKLNVFGLELHLEKTVFYVRTAGVPDEKGRLPSKGAQYAFDATTELGAVKWVDMLQRHKAYCREVAVYHAQRKAQQETEQRIAGLEAMARGLTAKVG